MAIIPFIIKAGNMVIDLVKAFSLAAAFENYYYYCWDFVNIKANFVNCLD